MNTLFNGAFFSLSLCVCAWVSAREWVNVRTNDQALCVVFIPPHCIFKRQIMRFLFMVLNVCWFSYLMLSNLNEFHMGKALSGFILYFIFLSISRLLALAAIFFSALFGLAFYFFRFWQNIADVSAFCSIFVRPPLTHTHRHRPKPEKKNAWGANETCHEYIWIVKCLWCGLWYSFDFCEF